MVVENEIFPKVEKVIIMLKIFINFTLDNPNALSICGFVNK
jgi:hypothetical protein